MMKNLMFSLIPVLSVGFAFAQLPPASQVQVQVQVQQRRNEVRLAVEAQRVGLVPGAVGERRLSPQERAELRQQLRQHNQARRDGDGKR